MGWRKTSWPWWASQWPFHCFICLETWSWLACISKEHKKALDNRLHPPQDIVHVNDIHAHFDEMSETNARCTPELSEAGKVQAFNFEQVLGDQEHLNKYLRQKLGDPFSFRARFTQPSITTSGADQNIRCLIRHELNDHLTPTKSASAASPGCTTSFGNWDRRCLTRTTSCSSTPATSIRAQYGDIKGEIIWKSHDK